jgi:hypothetical protein
MTEVYLSFSSLVEDLRTMAVLAICKNVFYYDKSCYESFYCLQFGPIVVIDLKIPPRPPGYAFIEVSKKEKIYCLLQIWLFLCQNGEIVTLVLSFAQISIMRSALPNLLNIKNW